MINLPILKIEYLLMECDLNGMEEISDSLWDIRILDEREAGPEEILGVGSREIERRFKNGDLCFVATDGIRQLGVIWGHRGNCYVRGAGKRLSLAPEDVYLYGVYTLPEARKQGVYSALKSCFLQQYRLLGAERVLALIDRKNDIMRISLRESAFREKAGIYYLRIGRFSFSLERDIETGKKNFRVIRREPNDCFII